jgi:hypothetical protein
MDDQGGFGVISYTHTTQLVELDSGKRMMNPSE